MKRVLIVEDDDDIREVLGELLGERYGVELATDGAEALAVLDRVTVDAIVLDLMMPVMDGETFLREMRARGHSRPVVLVSATRDLPARARSLLVAEHCMKPCSPDALEAALARVLSGAVGDNDTGG